MMMIMLTKQMTAMTMMMMMIIDKTLFTISAFVCSVQQQTIITINKNSQKKEDK